MSDARDAANHDWRRLFVGRDRELHWLIDAWRHAKTGNPQFLVLLAESGLGKTRLVQEFYRWLSRNEDPPSAEAPQGYWPDAFDSESTSLDVNPRFAIDERPRPKIPWLWWGLRFNRPDLRNQVGAECGLVDYRDALFIHTQPIAVSRRIREVRTDAALKTGSIAANFVPLAGLAFAMRDLYTLFTGEMAEHRRLSKQAVESPAQVHQREKTDLESLALDYFRTILDPGNTEAETVPVILFLDDAQWADPVTLRFLRKLMVDARAGNWPLLVLATHWEVEWRTMLDEYPEPADPPQRLTDLPLLWGLSTTWPGVRSIPPIDDLGAIVGIALPGLPGEQKALLLEKAGGNPLLLDEMLLFVLREPRFFDAHDVKRPLTPRAMAELTRRTFRLHDLVRDRFARLEESVKRCLGWSSEQGMRFLSAITLAAARRVAPTLGEDELRDVLQRGENPHCFIQLDRESGKFNRGEFRQAAFHHVAAEYLAFDPVELEGVQAAVRDTLVDWLDDGSIDELPAGERQDALLMARRFLRPSADSSSSLWGAWGRALVRLVRVYSEEFLWEQAWEAAETFADARPAGWDLNLVEFWDQIVVIDRLRHARDYRRAKALADPLRREVESRSPADRESLRDVGVYLNRVGDVELALGQRESALLAFRRGLEICERITHDFGETPESLRDLSASLVRVGGVELTLGQRESALLAFRQSLEICEHIIRDFGETPQSLQDLSFCLVRVGDMELTLGQRETALLAFRRSLKIRERIIRDFGETPESLRDLSASLVRVGGVELALGQRETALLAFRRSLEIRERIIRDFGETPESLRDLSASLVRVGGVELALGQRETALLAFRRSLEICERIVRDFGETPESLRDIGASLVRVGGAELTFGQRETALLAFRRSLEIRERIVRDFGETPASLRDLGASLVRVGGVELTLGQRETVLLAFRRSLEICERIIRDFGETPQSLQDLSFCLVRFGGVELALGQRETALLAFRRSLEIRERIVRDFGETPESLRDLAASEYKLAMLDIAVENNASAIVRLRRAAELTQSIIDKGWGLPQNDMDLRSIGEMLRKLS